MGTQRCWIAARHRSQRPAGAWAEVPDQTSRGGGYHIQNAPVEKRLAKYTATTSPYPLSVQRTLSNGTFSLSQKITCSTRRHRDVHIRVAVVFLRIVPSIGWLQRR